MKLTTGTNSGTYTQGLHKNVKLIEANVNNSKNAEIPILILKFELEDSTIVTHSEYMPLKFDNETEEVFTERKVKWASKRLPFFMKVVDGEINIEFDETSKDKEMYTNTFNAIAESINSAPGIKTEPLAVVFTQNQDGYLQLPNGINYGVNRFLGKMNEYESMKVQYDKKMEQQGTAATTTYNSDVTLPQTMNTGTITPTNEMPF